MDQNKIRLWEEGKTPLFDPAVGQEEPYIRPFFLPDAPDAPCMLVCPGGGYSVLCDTYEGEDICRKLNENGVHAAMLHYRVNPYLHPCMELDAKRAIRTLRANAAAYGIHPRKIGIMGFSAGGHLTCMAALRFDEGIADGDGIDKVSSRPDFAAPCYAVTTLVGEAVTPTMPEHTVGEPVNAGLAASLSAQNIVRPDAPPFFIWHTATDNLVPVENALMLAGALHRQGVSCELHVFPEGCHGLGLAENTPTADGWFGLMVKWIRFITK